MPLFYKEANLFSQLILVTVCGMLVVSLTFLADNFGPHIFQVGAGHHIFVKQQWNCYCCIYWSVFINNKILRIFSELLLNSFQYFLSHHLYCKLVYKASPAFQVCFAFLGATGGPQLGLFLLGALIPWVNKQVSIHISILNPFNI